MPSCFGLFSFGLLKYCEDGGIDSSARACYLPHCVSCPTCTRSTASPYKDARLATHSHS